MPQSGIQIRTGCSVNARSSRSYITHALSAAKAACGRKKALQHGGSTLCDAVATTSSFISAHCDRSRNAAAGIIVVYFGSLRYQGDIRGAGAATFRRTVATQLVKITTEHWQPAR